MRYLILTVLVLLYIFPSSIYAQNNYDFKIARLHYQGGGDWYSDPTSLPNLLEAVSNRLNLKTPKEEEEIKITDSKLYKYPFLYMTGHGNVKFTSREVSRLRDFLTHGGFLWADDNYGMDESFRKEIKKVFPKSKLTPLPSSHKIFNSYYNLKGLPKIHKHDNKSPKLFAIYYKGRIVCIYSYEADIGDGLEDPSVHDDPEEKHELALKMGINIVYYFLTH